MSFTDRLRLFEIKNRIQDDYLIILMSFLPQQESITRINKEQLLEKLMAHFSTLQTPREVFPFWQYQWHLEQEYGVGSFCLMPSQPVNRFEDLIWQLSAFLPVSRMCNLETMLQNLVEHIKHLQPIHPIDNKYRVQRAMRIGGSYRVSFVWVKPGELYEDTQAILEIEAYLRMSASHFEREREDVFNEDSQVNEIFL